MSVEKRHRRCQERSSSKERTAESLFFSTYVFMFESCEDFDFSQSPLTVRLVFKRWNLLDRHSSFRQIVLGWTAENNKNSGTLDSHCRGTAVEIGKTAFVPSFQGLLGGKNQKTHVTIPYNTLRKEIQLVSRWYTNRHVASLMPSVQLTLDHTLEEGELSSRSRGPKRSQRVMDRGAIIDKDRNDGGVNLGKIPVRA